MKVVSLFDGIACGLVALKKAGITVDEYHAFEIDKHAIDCAIGNAWNVNTITFLFKGLINNEINFN